MNVNLIYTASCGLILFVYLFVALLFHTKSKAYYADFLEPLTDNDSRVRKFLHIGLFIQDNINFTQYLPKALIQILGRKKAEVRVMIMELKEGRYADYYFTIFYAEKRVYSLCIMIMATGLGLIMCLQGDGSTGIGFSLVGVVFAVAFGFMLDGTLKKKIDERHTSLRMEFPDFVNKLVLLINAGMTVNRAWEKIVLDNKKDTPLQQELRIAYLSMKNGTPEAYAIESFGRRCKIKEIMKFTSVLISNLKKGGAEMVPVLVQQSNECWEMRKGAAKEMGATAGVKMMLPMVMLLGAILLVVGFPALLSFSGV